MKNKNHSEHENDDRSTMDINIQMAIKLNNKSKDKRNAYKNTKIKQK